MPEMDERALERLESKMAHTKTREGGELTDNTQALTTTEQNTEAAPDPYQYTKALEYWGRGSPKYPHVWNADTKERVLAAFHEGASLSQVCVVIGIARRTFYDWLGADGKGDFTETITRGTEIAKAWWLEQARKGLWSKEFNGRTFEFMMRNMYGWAGLGPTEQLPVGSKGAEVDESEGVRDTVDTNEIIRKARESALDVEFTEVKSEPAGTTTAGKSQPAQAQTKKKAKRKKKAMPPMPPKKTKKVSAAAAKAKVIRKKKKSTASQAKSKTKASTKRRK